MRKAYELGQEPPQLGELLAAEQSGGTFTRKALFIVAAAVMLAALGYFAVMVFMSATVYSYSVSEMAELGPTPQGELVRVNGSLVAESFRRADGSTLAQFTLTDDAAHIDAKYDGVLPDLFFNEHSEIILEGHYGEDGVFASQNVLVKCPSKYVALEDDASAYEAE